MERVRSVWHFFCPVLRPRRRHMEESSQREAKQPSTAQTYSVPARVHIENIREFNRLKYRGNDSDDSTVKHRLGLWRGSSLRLILHLLVFAFFRVLFTWRGHSNVPRPSYWWPESGHPTAGTATWAETQTQGHEKRRRRRSAEWCS